MVFRQKVETSEQSNTDQKEELIMSTNLETTATNGPRKTVLTALVAVVATGAVAAGLMLGFGGSGTPAAAAAPAPTTHTVIIHDTTHTVTPAPKPVVHPSTVVETLQQELGNLNYYNGQIDGYMGPQTVAAITYLQRDAGLPQTGQMNAATQAALIKDLAQGNNQMAG